MPNYKSHISGGFLVFVPMVLFLIPRHHPSLTTVLEWLACIIAGSLFPDIDTKSKGQRYFYILMIPFLIFLIIRHQYRPLAIASTCAFVPLLVSHRGIFHRLWFVVAIPFIGWYMVTAQFPYLHTALLFDTVFFVVGAISHLWLDLGFRMLR